MTRQPLALLYRALFPPPMPSSERGKALWRVMNLRAHRAWITTGCYAWWRFSDDLKEAQRDLLALRKRSTA